MQTRLAVLKGINSLNSISYGFEKFSWVSFLTLSQFSETLGLVQFAFEYIDDSVYLCNYH